ncbi:glycosyltransferase [Pseudomonas sp. ODNR1LW]|nr:glycosyltransferase [Pseudomonas sp. ODNR1LW]
MKISVLINNFNYGRFLKACVDSALGQAHADFEVVVVDDGSTDESREIIDGYGNRIVPVLKANGGQASSFNAGFAHATGEIICLLDADDAFLAGKLERIAALYADDALDWCFDRVTTDEDAITPETLQLTPIDKREAMRRGGFPSLPVPTSGLSFRRRVLQQILPMPVAQDVVLSDNYLKFAAAYLGRGVIINTPLTFQRIHTQNRYTGQSQANPLKPRIMVATGLALAQRYPELDKVGASLAAGGFAQGDLKGRALWHELRRVTRDAPNPRAAAWDLRARVALKRMRAAIGPKP